MKQGKGTWLLCDNTDNPTQFFNVIFIYGEALILPTTAAPNSAILYTTREMRRVVDAVGDKLLGMLGKEVTSKDMPQLLDMEL